MTNKCDSPNIKLRVFRREEYDMTLIYNVSELKKIYKNKIKLKVLINGKEMSFTESYTKAKDSNIDDKFLLIPYPENNLNDKERYIVTLIFGKNNSENEFIYKIAVEPRGTLPSLKDNKNLFSQVLGYDTDKNRWIKIQVIENEKGENEVLVKDSSTKSLLKEIKDLLIKILEK